MRPRLIPFRAIQATDHAPTRGDATGVPDLADLLDPVALERRLAVARVRRAKALAERRAAREAAETARIARAAPPPLVAQPGQGAEPAGSLAARRASSDRPRMSTALLVVTLLVVALLLAGLIWGKALGERLAGLVGSPGPAPVNR